MKTRRQRGIGAGLGASALRANTPSPSLPRQGQMLGFTLIEVMVVVAILAVMLTLSYPAIREAVHRAPMTQAVLDVMEGCRKARARAILSGKPAELRIYQDGRLEVGDAPADVDPSAASSSSIPSTQPILEVPGNAPKASPQNFSAKISDSVSPELLEINFQDFMHTDVARVAFYPNGTSDEFTMVLFCPESGERRKIALEVVTALADVKAL